MLYSDMKDEKYWKAFVSFVAAKSSDDAQDRSEIAKVPTANSKQVNAALNSSPKKETSINEKAMLGGESEISKENGDLRSTNVSPYEGYDNIFPTNIFESKIHEDSEPATRNNNQPDDLVCNSPGGLSKFEPDSIDFWREMMLKRGGPDTMTLPDWMTELGGSLEEPLEFDNYSDEFAQNQQFIPTLTSIVEEDETETHCDVIDEGRKLDHLEKVDEMPRSQSFERLSEASFISLQRSGTYDNLSSFEENERILLQQDENENDSKRSKCSPTHVIEFPCTSGDHFYSAIGLSNNYKNVSARSSFADSAYSSREKINIIRGSIPSISVQIAEENEDVAYIPESYAAKATTTTKKKKKRRWASFNVSDNREKLRGSRINDRDSFRKRIARRFSSKSSSPSKSPRNEVSPRKAVQRKSSFRKTVDRILRGLRLRSHRTNDITPTRGRTWSLPTAQEMASSTGSEESVIEIEHGVI